MRLANCFSYCFGGHCQAPFVWGCVRGQGQKLFWCLLPLLCEKGAVVGWCHVGYTCLLPALPAYIHVYISFVNSCTCNYLFIYMGREHYFQRALLCNLQFFMLTSEFSKAACIYFIFAHFFPMCPVLCYRRNTSFSPFWHFSCCCILSH